MTSIGVIDHGAGNLVSITRALEHVGADVTTVTRTRDLSGFAGVVLPGVGATGAVMRNMHRRDLVDPVVAYDGPLLGICVGMQVLFDHSDEDDNACLGLLPGKVRRLDVPTLPHMGWNDVAGPDRLIPDEPSSFYFVHSFVAEPSSEDQISGWTTVEGDRFPSVVRAGRVVGVQFHPERSGPAGLGVLGQFVSEAREARRAA